MEVKVGQIWQDNDSRFLSNPGMKRIIKIDGLYAYCESWWLNSPSVTRPVKIRIDRFKNTGSGYRLVKEG